MSLLSTEHLSIFLSPGTLVAVRWGGLPRKIVEKNIYPVAAHDGSNWEGAILTFAEVLRNAPCRRVRVTLSCHFTQYQVQPWRDDLVDDAEELAFARLAFGETYGDTVSRWSIRLSDEAPGQSRVAVAVDTDLLGALEQAAQASGARLTSVQPYLSAAANEWRRHFDRASSKWLVLQEENRVCLALIEHGHWQWVRCLRIAADWCERLPEVVENEILLAGTDTSPDEVLIFAPSEPVLTLRTDTHLPFRSLCLAARRGFSPMNDSLFGLALIG